MVYATSSYAEQMSLQSQCARVQIGAGQVNSGCCLGVCCDPSMRRSSWQGTSLSMSGIAISHPPNNCLNRPPLPLPRRLCFLCSGALPTGLIFEAVACVESMHRNRIGRVSGSGSMNRLRDLSIGRQRSIPTLDCRQSFKGKEGFSPRTSQTFVLSLLQHELLDARTKVDSARGGSGRACEGRRTEAFVLG